MTPGTVRSPAPSTAPEGVRSTHAKSGTVLLHGTSTYNAYHSADFLFPISCPHQALVLDILHRHHS